jgi:hypothetical protein
MTTVPHSEFAGQSPLPHHQQLIDGSAILPAVAAARGYRTVTKRAELKALGFASSQCRVPGLLIPLHNVHGKASGYQLRPDDPREVRRKRIRYETPKGARLQVDVPPAAREHLADPSVDLVITEGVRKSDAAVSKGLCCIDLLGVWGWRGKNDKGGMTVLADWESIALKGRKVFLAFDSDVSCKPSVRIAMERLKAFLEHRGATVKVIYLPAGPSGEKVGLDDYFAADHTVDELMACVADEIRPLGRPGSASVEEDDRPTILVEPGDLPRVVDQAEEALQASHGEKLYERGGEIVRLVRIPTPSAAETMDRIRGTLAISVVDVTYLVERLTRAARFQRATPTGEIRDIDCPDRVAKTYLARRGNRLLEPLTGIIECPILRSDGTVLATQGYDKATGLFLDLNGLVVPPIVDQPTKDDALAALVVLRQVFKDFSFVALCDYAAALAAALTTLVRVSIRTAPMTAVRAPKMGSGKSLLVDAIAMIATGRVAPVMPQGRDDEEIRKRLLAILLAGYPLACIDNVERPLGGDTICSVLTQVVYRDRILGKSETATVPTSTTWFATGNNLEFVGDITTRVIVCDLDPACEHPERRPFDVDLRRYVLLHRGKLIAAGLTVLRAYQVAGRPSQGLPTFGRFEEWSDLVRSALVWLGEADPCEGIQRIEDADPTRTSLRGVLLAWEAVFADRAVTVADALRAANEDTPKGKALLEAAKDVAAGREGKPEARRLGKWLPKIVLRIEANLRFERAGERSNAGLWRVRRIVRPSVTSVTSAEAGAPVSTPDNCPAVTIVTSVTSPGPAAGDDEAQPEDDEPLSRVKPGVSNSPNSPKSREPASGPESVTIVSSEGPGAQSADAPPAPLGQAAADQLADELAAAIESGDAEAIELRLQALVAGVGAELAAVIERNLKAEHRSREGEP